MKSKRVGHGHVKWAVCSALLSATTLAAAAPRGSMLDGGAHLSFGFSRITDRQCRATKVSYCIRASRIDRPSAGAGASAVRPASPNRAAQVTREQVAAEQAAFISARWSRARRAPKSSRSCSSRSTPSCSNVDAADLPALARDTAITRVVGVSDYAHDLSETVPYIGASTAHSLGATRPGCARRRHRQRHRLHARRISAARARRPRTKLHGRRFRPPAPSIPVVPAGTGYLVIDDPGTTADDGLFPSAKVDRWLRLRRRKLAERGPAARSGSDPMRSPMPPRTAVTARMSPTSSPDAAVWLPA